MKPGRQWRFLHNQQKAIIPEFMAGYLNSNQTAFCSEFCGVQNNKGGHSQPLYQCPITCSTSAGIDACGCLKLAVGVLLSFCPA